MLWARSLVSIGLSIRLVAELLLNWCQLSVPSVARHLSERVSARLPPPPPPPALVPEASGSSASCMLCGNCGGGAEESEADAAREPDASAAKRVTDACRGYTQGCKVYRAAMERAARGIEGRAAELSLTRSLQNSSWFTVPESSASKRVKRRRVLTSGKLI